MTCGRDLLDCQVIPGCFQHVSDTRTGEWEEELLDTAEHASILKLTRGGFSLWDVYLVAWGDWTWVSLHSNLTVCKEGCSPAPCLLCKKQSCLTCKRVKPELQTWFRFSGGAEPARPQDQKGHPSLIYCLYPISAHLFPQQMLWADFMLYLMAQGFTSPVCCL